MPQHYQPVAAGTVAQLGRGEQPPRRGGETQHAEHIAQQRAAVEDLGLPPAGEPESPGRRGRKGLEPPVPVPPVAVVGDRERAQVPGMGAEIERDQPLRLPEGERPEQRAAHHAPDGGIGPDGQGDGGDGHRGKAGPAAEAADRVTEGRGEERNAANGG